MASFEPRSMKRKNVKGLALNAPEPRQEAPDTANTQGSGARSNRDGQDNKLEIGLEFRLDLRNDDLIVLEELGAGNGGTVTKVKHAATKAIMARKIIHVEAKREVRKRIVTELAIMHECNSPYIISFYGAFMSDTGDVVMCIEYMDVGSLDSISKNFGPVRVDVLGKIAEAILAGLTYLYSAHRIMHRDIKPSNVLVNSRGSVKLCDFGVSGQLANSIAETFVGTGTYMAPERIQGGSYTVKSDVWSVGLTLMELAIGRFPFGADNDADGDNFDAPQGILDLLQQIVMEPAPKLPKSDAFPVILEDMIAKCLMKDPGDRPTPQELYEHDDFVQAAKRTPVDLQAWALGLMERRNGKSTAHQHLPAAPPSSQPPANSLAYQLSPSTQDFLASQRSSPASIISSAMPTPGPPSAGYGDIPIGNLTLNADGTGVTRVTAPSFPARTSSVATSTSRPHAGSVHSPPPIIPDYYPTDIDASGYANSYSNRAMAISPPMMLPPMMPPPQNMPPPVPEKNYAPYAMGFDPRRQQYYPIQGYAPNQAYAPNPGYGYGGYDPRRQY